MNLINLSTQRTGYCGNPRVLIRPKAALAGELRLQGAFEGRNYPSYIWLH